MNRWHVVLSQLMSPPVETKPPPRGNEGILIVLWMWESREGCVPARVNYDFTLVGTCMGAGERDDVRDEEDGQDHDSFHFVL